MRHFCNSSASLPHSLKNPSLSNVEENHLPNSSHILPETCYVLSFALLPTPPNKEVQASRAFCYPGAEWDTRGCGEVGRGGGKDQKWKSQRNHKRKQLKVRNIKKVKQSDSLR